MFEVLRRAGSKIFYLYDFGDSWEHTILLEKILPPDPGLRHPVCTAGKMAAPPEDSGGLWEYAMKMEALQDPEHEDYDEVIEWIGEEYDPTLFDLEKINKRLSRIKWK